MALGKRISEVLGERDQKFLYASIPGLTQQSLSALISRDSKTSEFAIRIAAKLGVSARWLLDGSGERDEIDWPFPGIDRERFDALSHDQKMEIQGVVRTRIEAFEAENVKRSLEKPIAA